MVRVGAERSVVQQGLVCPPSEMMQEPGKAGQEQVFHVGQALIVGEPELDCLLIGPQRG